MEIDVNLDHSFCDDCFENFLWRAWITCVTPNLECSRSVSLEMRMETGPICEFKMIYQVDSVDDSTEEEESGGKLSYKRKVFKKIIFGVDTSFLAI